VTRYSPRTGLPTTYQVGPFDSSHVYVQWGGKLPGGEQWSCGFRMWKTGGSTEADGAGLLVSVSAALATFHGRAATAINTKALFSYVKTNTLGTDGRYVGAGTNEATYADLPGGQVSGAMFTNQTTVAVTLQTGFSRGPAHQGRFFLPLPALDLDATGRMSVATAAAIKGSCATLLTNVNANTSGHVMVVMSRKAGAPGHRAVTGFEVGTVLDTQRRRRRSLIENYQ
jgi:hypothetical protein